MSTPYPPEDLRIFVGAGDFVAMGHHWRRFLTGTSGLAPHHRVLDIGCGIGRIAIPLTEVLTGEGSYEGFDVVKEGVAWCSENITPDHPNFRFQHSDVINAHYNPNGAFRAAEYRFPFDDGEFDRVVLTSVFTHMFPADMEHYVSEVARVLKPGGQCVLTAFLLNDESREHIAMGRSKLPFTHRITDICFTSKPDDPERAIAFDEHYLRGVLAEHGLAVRQPVQFGAWSGRTPAPRYQDVIQADYDPSQHGSNVIWSDSR